MFNRVLVFIVVFLNFLGFYAALLTMSNLNMLEFSRSLTVPLRLVIVGSLLVLFLICRKLPPSFTLNLFCIFSALFFLRITLDILTIKTYYISFQQVLFYYISFAFIPFVIIKSIHLTPNHLNVAKRAFLLSSLLFGLLATIFYAKYVGTVGRLTSAMVEDDVISPLILSYCSALVVGVSLNLLMVNRLKFKQVAFLLTLIALSLTPFFLGASRGSIIALIIPFIFIVVTNRRIKNNIKIVLSFFFIFFTLLIASERFGSGVFDRLFSIGNDIERGNSSALRVQIWDQSYEQFANSPLFGDKLEVTGFSIYPHNLFLEVLQTTGLLGFVPFLILVVLSLRECLFIFKNYRSYSWLAVIFLQSFAQNMFSGSLFNASWFWFSMAIMLSFRRWITLYQNKLDNSININSSFNEMPTHLQ